VTSCRIHQSNMEMGGLVFVWYGVYWLRLAPNGIVDPLLWENAYLYVILFVSCFCSSMFNQYFIIYFLFLE
jgi:hypothetical protein